MAAAAASPNAAEIERLINERRERQTHGLTTANQQYREEIDRKEQDRQRLTEQIRQIQEALNNPATSQEQSQQLQQQLLRAQEQLNQITQNSQHLFRVITGKIKNLIGRLQNAVANGGNLNQVIKETVESLETMGLEVSAYAQLKAKSDDTLARPKQIRGDISQENIRQFIDNDNKQLDANGILSANGKTITLETLDTVQLVDPNRLETEDEAEEATEEQIRNRLINCQYLEILYLTKHDELMKIFRFTLNLYDKYTYAIKILLFVLKNLLNQRPCPPTEQIITEVPGAPRKPEEPAERTGIKLPKALISNIKQLLKDQKQVQDVINRMRPIVENTLPGLVNEREANEVSYPFVGSNIDETNP